MKQLSIKVVRFLILGKKIYGVEFILGTMFLGTNYHYPKGTRGQFPGGILPGGNYHWGNFLGAITQVAFIRGSIFFGGNYPWSNCPWSNFPRGTIILRGNFPDTTWAHDILAWVKILMRVVWVAQAHKIY